MREKKIRSIFMVEPSLKEMAGNLAKEQGISYSELLRRAILLYLGGDVTLEERITAIEKELVDIKKWIKNV